VRVARQPPGGIRIPEHLGGGHPLADPRHETIAQRTQPHGLRGSLGDGELRGERERGSTGDVLRAGAESALLPSAVLQRREAGRAGDDERPRAGGRADLVPGDAERHEAGSRRRVAAELRERQRQMPESRDGVQMQGTPADAAEAASAAASLTVPTSLFAISAVARATPSDASAAAKASTGIRPTASRPTGLTRAPSAASAATVSSVAWCSPSGSTIASLPSGRERHSPCTARFTDSVPPR
jgi:hypothetical protein